MLWFGSVSAVAIAAIGAFAWWLLQTRRMPLGNFVGVIGLAVWFAVVGVVWLVDKPADAPSQRLRSMKLTAWPVAPESTLVTPAAARPATATNGAGQIASVESMIGGLEARLKAQPDDANGWALLAQSYAYTSDDAALERALQRAVELGIDEQALRERVAGARRSVHPGSFAAEGNGQ